MTDTKRGWLQSARLSLNPQAQQRAARASTTATLQTVKQLPKQLVSPSESVVSRIFGMENSDATAYAADDTGRPFTYEQTADCALPTTNLSVYVFYVCRE